MRKQNCKTKDTIERMETNSKFQHEKEKGRPSIRLKRSSRKSTGDESNQPSRNSVKPKIGNSSIDQLDAIDDADIAAAAIKLVISCSRKGFVTLCTKVALILKENLKYKKGLILHTDRNQSGCKTTLSVNIKKLIDSDKVINKLNDAKSEADPMNSYKVRKLRTLHESYDENLNYKSSAEKPVRGCHSITAVAEVHHPRQKYKNPSSFNHAECLDDKNNNCDRGNVPLKPPLYKEWLPQHQSTLLEETSDTENNENVCQARPDASPSKNPIRKAVRFWKKKYLIQCEIAENLQKQLMELKGQISKQELRSTNKENGNTAEKSVECNILQETAVSHEVEECYVDSDGWKKLLDRLHDIPLQAPEVLQGCRCSRCECMLNPVYNANYKDIKAYRLISNSKPLLQIDDVVLIPGDRVCRVAYVGHLDEPGLLDVVFVGLILKRPEGRSDGCHRDRRYFICDKNCGLFLPINWIVLIIKKADKYK